MIHLEKYDVKTQVKQSILIFLFGAIPMGFLMCPQCFKDFELGFPVALFSGLMWLFLWKGNEYIYVYTDKYVSWFKTPLKRMFIGLGLMVLYSSLIVSIIAFIFYIIVFKQEIDNSFFAQLRETAFYSIIVSIIIMSFFTARSFLFAWRQEAINAEKIKRDHISMQYEALKNQVNPHFLFNSLNALSSLIYENREKAVEFINRLSDVYRYVLDSKDKEVVPVSEELIFVRSYLFLLKARFENNLIAEININEEKGYIPPMALQMLIENAVKHNEISDEHPLKISVFEKDRYIYVKNNVQLKVQMDNTPPVPLDRGEMNTPPAPHDKGRPTDNPALTEREDPGSETNEGKKRISAHQLRRAGMQGDGTIIPPRRDSDGLENREGFSKSPQGIGLKNIESRYSILSDNPVIIERSEEVFCIGIPVLQIV